MKDFTKSLIGAGIATAVFSARQAGVVLTRPPGSEGPHPATDAFNAIAQAAADQCGNGLRESMNTMDKAQRQAVDAVFQIVSLDTLNKGNRAESVTTVFNQATQQLQNWFRDGCGSDREPEGPTDFDRDCNCG